MDDDQIEGVGHTVVTCFSLFILGIFLMLAVAAHFWGFEL